MPSFDMKIPSFSPDDLDDEKQRRRILSYLTALHEQLRYLLNNLDEDNLSDGLTATLDGKADGMAVQHMSGQVAGLDGRMMNAESEIIQMPGQISAAVKAVQVGGANLFTGTKDFSGTDWTRLSSWTVSTSTYNGCNYAYKTGAWNCMSQKVWVEAGMEYTYSMWVKCSSSQTMQYLFYRDGTTGHCTVEGGNTGTIANVGTEWQRISFTKKVATSGWAEPGIDVQNSGVTWYICGIKFEQGNKATYWTESDSDIRTYTSAQLTILDNEISSKASQTSVTDLTTRMDTAESKITPTAITNTVRSSTEYQNDLDGKVNTSTLANYSTTSQTAQEISAQVTAVQVGGVNLFTGTRRFADDGQWQKLSGWTITDTEYNGCLVAQKAAAWNCMSQKVTVEAGAEYTYSAWVKCSSAQTMQWLFYRGETTGHCTIEGSATGTIRVGTSWQRVSFTVKVLTGGIAEPGIDVQNNGVTWYICGIKLERGNKATDWSEAEGEFFAGSTARMTSDGFFFGGNQFEIDVPGDENFHLDSAGGSMKNFSADTVKAKNLAEVYTGPASVTIGSSGTYKSLTEFANAVNNRVVDKTVTVTLSDSNYYESVEFAGITGGGRLWFQGAKTITGQTRFVNNTAYMRFDNTVFVGRVYMLNVSFIAFESCTFNGNGDGTGSSVQEALFLDNGSKCHANGCGIYNAASLIRVEAGSTFTSNNMKGGNCVNFILATRCSVCMQGTRPSGNRATTTVLSPNDMTSLTIDYGTATPVVNPTTTTTISCKASRTAYDAGSPKWYNAVGDVPQARLRQGFLNMGSSGNNEQYGCFWFDTSALSGKTIKSALLTLTRIAGYGRSSEVSVRLYTTPLTSASGNPLTNAVDQGVLGTIGNGETKQFTIPTAAISASANKGFMLRVDDGALISGRGYSDNYAHFYGYGESSAPVLTVTYEG